MPAVHVFGLREALPRPRRRWPGRCYASCGCARTPPRSPQLRAAGAAIDRVHARMGEFLKAGRTEAQVGADIAAAIVEEGHTEAAFVIVGSGPWNPLRLEAEVIRDSVLSVSGELNLTQGGPGFLPDLDDELLKARGTWWEPSPQEERNRRTVYMGQLRSFPFPLVSVFDGADMGQSCAAREVTNTTPQVFALFNNQFVHEQSHKMAQRIRRELEQDAAGQVERAFQLAFQRLPTVVERAKCLAFLGYPSPDPHQFATAMPLTPADSKSDTLPDLQQPVARKASLSDLCLVLLNMNEFVYLD